MNIAEEQNDPNRSDKVLRQLAVPVVLEADEDEDTKYGRKFWGKLISCVTLLPIIMWLFPSLVPWHYFDIWTTRGSVSQWL